MDSIAKRLTNCFQIVFPELSPADVPAATQSSLATWDSVAAITLVNVIEDEFAVQIDFDRLAELDSFEKIHDYLSGEISIA